MDEFREREFGLDFYDPKPLVEILKGIKPVPAEISTAEAKEIINPKYPQFNFSSLDDNQISVMASLATALKSKGNEVSSLVHSGKRKEAFQLAENVRTIDDPQASYLTTPLKELLVFTRGNLNEVTFNLGISEITDAEKWVEFMIRSWGMKPEDFKAVNEVHREEWRTLVANIRKYITENNLPQEFIAWPNPEIFKRLYIPEFGSLFRGIRGMDEAKIKELVDNGMDSRLLSKLGSFEKVRELLKGKSVSAEFKNHYAGAGEDDLFWQSPEQSPFVALSQWRTIPLWHASIGEKYRILVELAPKYHTDTLGYETLKGTPENERIQAEEVAGIAFPEQNFPTFNNPFIYITKDEIAFYPKIDPKDIAKIHLIPSNLATEGINESPDVIPYLKNPGRLS